MNIIQQINKEQVEKLSAGKTIPDFAPGDTVLVNVKVVEGDKSRIQAYEGVCIGRAGGGINENFTVRKISYGEGVERVFPLYAPMIDSIKVVRRGKVRRAKLYYLRGRRGKSARIVERQDHTAGGGAGPAQSPRPERLRGKPCAFGECAKLRPDQILVQPRAQSAIGASDHVRAPDRFGEVADSLRDELGMLDEVGGVADHARHDDLAGGQLDVLPQRPFVLVTHIAGFETAGLPAHL